MADKLYKDCPKSYRLLCSKDDEEGVRAALDQLRSDHPEVFLLDDIYEPYCHIVSNKIGLCVLKNVVSAYTLADDLKVEKEVFPEYRPDVVLRISPDHVFVYEKGVDGGIFEIEGPKRRFIVDGLKQSDPGFSKHIHSEQARLHRERKFRCGLFS